MALLGAMVLRLWLDIMCDFFVDMRPLCFMPVWVLAMLPRLPDVPGDMLESVDMLLPDIPDDIAPDDCALAAPAIARDAMQTIATLNIKITPGAARPCIGRDQVCCWE